MIYRVTLPNGETLHTGHGPLSDVWLNRHGGKLERIPLASIKSVAAEMWDGSPLTAALISVDRLRAILNDKDGQMDAMFKELGAWRAAFVRHNGLAYDPERDAIVHMDTGREYKSVGEQEAPFTCKYCGQPSWIDPSDQSPPPDYCHEIDHGTAEDRTGS